MPAQPDASLSPDPVEPQPRSRRALLTAALGGLAGAVAGALGRPAETQAAPGDNLKLGQTNYAGGSATRLNATSSGGAFWMTQYGYGSGVRSDSVNGHGGVFTTAHPDRYGLSASNTGAAGNGAAVRADGGANGGVSGSSTDGIGVSGTSINVHGVKGSSTNNAGVFGSSTNGYGLYGTSTSYRGVAGVSSSNYGVYGSSGSSAGVFGESFSSNGVYGTSFSSTGVAGVSTNGAGVYGTSSTSYAGYFDGSLFATSAHANIKAFRIDHPLDPANKVLMHSCVESNERKLVYDGVVTTDAKGEATVTLPGYFGALNRDLRYQLTPVGASMPDLHVASAVRGNRFTIAGASPGGEVCWQITGVRQDAYAKAHPLQVESAKIGKEKGRYLTPLEHGQPARLAVDYELRRQVRQTPTAPPA